MIEVARQAYPDRDTLMRDLAELVADQLRGAHASKGRATLAVPGGTTPGPFLRRCRRRSSPGRTWPCCRPTSGWSPRSSSRSNARLIRSDAAQERGGRGAAGGAARAAARVARSVRVAAALPIDVLVLGMGADMHTASLFPGAPELAAALAEDAPALMEIRPPGQPEARLTLTAPVLRGAGVIHILITGADKLAALETALRRRAGRRGAGAGGADRALPGDRALCRVRGGSHDAQRHRRPRHRADRRALGAGAAPLSRPDGAGARRRAEPGASLLRQPGARLCGDDRRRQGGAGPRRPPATSGSSPPTTTCSRRISRTRPIRR